MIRIIDGDYPAVYWFNNHSPVDQISSVTLAPRNLVRFRYVSEQLLAVSIHTNNSLSDECKLLQA